MVSTALSAVIASTLQLLRLSVDFIQIASSPPPSSSATQGGSRGPSSEGDAKSQPPNESATTDPKIPNYGSVHPSSDSHETKPLLSGDEENALTTNTALNESDPSNRSTTQRRFRLFLAAWLVAAVVFVVTIVVSKHSSSSSTQQGSFDVVYPSSLVIATILVMMVEIACHFLDAERLHYGAFRRLLRLTALLVLWCTFLTHLLHFESSASRPNRWSFNARNVLLVDVTFLVVLAVADGWVTNTHPTPARRESLDQAAHQPTLSRAALLQLVKPYVWPDATSETALWNRVRAIATWVCVICSKACSLLTPLLLGQASTALAHQDYGGTIRLVILYSAISWLGSTFKEGQFLFYLKVGQAAFVQLSEASFDHLHHLSLDWHLRKKLGEVLRSVDRGIAACDT